MASATMGLAISMSWSRSSKALLICVSVALALASIERSMPARPERITRPEAEEETGAGRGTDSDGCVETWYESELGDIRLIHRTSVTVTIANSDSFFDPYKGPSHTKNHQIM